MTDNIFYTLKEIAEQFKVSDMTVYRWIRSKKIKAYKVGKSYRIKQKDLKIFIESNAVI